MFLGGKATWQRLPRGRHSLGRTWSRRRFGDRSGSFYWLQAGSSSLGRSHLLGLIAKFCCNTCRGCKPWQMVIQRSSNSLWDILQWGACLWLSFLCRSSQLHKGQILRSEQCCHSKIQGRKARTLVDQCTARRCQVRTGIDLKPWYQKGSSSQLGKSCQCTKSKPQGSSSQLGRLYKKIDKALAGRCLLGS